MSRRRRVRAALALCAWALLAASAAAASAAAARAEASFALVAQTALAGDGALAAGRRCPQTVVHESVGTFRNIDPGDPDAAKDAVRFGDLMVDGGACNGSVDSKSAMVLEDVKQSPGGTAVEVAEMFFLQGTDNSARRCERYQAALPAFYYFTDSMPLFRERMEREGLVPAGSANLAAAVESRVYMLSRQYSRRDGSVLDNVVCTYISAEEEEDATPVGTVEMDEDGGSACFPAAATVRVAIALGDGPVRFMEKRMDEVKIGDIVSVGYGTGDAGADTVSDVFFFSHRNPGTLAEFVVLEMEAQGDGADAGESSACLATGEGGERRDDKSGKTSCASGSQVSTSSLTLSPSHYVLTRPRGLVLASEVLPREDSLVREDGTSAPVVAVRRLAAHGLFAPHTLRGSLVVDGFVVSSYTAAVPPAFAHAILAPLRFMYVVLGLAVESVLDQSPTAGGVAWPTLVRPQTGKLHSHCRRASWGIVGRLVELVVCPFLVIPTKAR